MSPLTNRGLKVDLSVINGPLCFGQVGDEGAGHFVKMVHNGIEYGDMQLICEAYHLMKDVLGMEHDEMAEVSTPPNTNAPHGNKHRSDHVVPRSRSRSGSWLFS